MNAMTLLHSNDCNRSGQKVPIMAALISIIGIVQNNEFIRSYLYNYAIVLV